MLKWICAAGLAVALAAPAMAQNRPPKTLTGPDGDVLKQAADTLKLSGTCNTEYTIGTDGKAKDIKPNCDPADFNDWVVKSMAAMTFQTEMVGGQVFETESRHQPFKFGVIAAEPAAAAPVVVDREPVPTKAIDPKEVDRAVTRAKQGGHCAATLTVGVDGVPKNVKPNCQPSGLDRGIKEAIESMRFQPGIKAGKPADWDITQQITADSKE